MPLRKISIPERGKKTVPHPTINPLHLGLVQHALPENCAFHCKCGWTESICGRSYTDICAVKDKKLLFVPLRKVSQFSAHVRIVINFYRCIHESTCKVHAEKLQEFVFQFVK